MAKLLLIEDDPTVQRYLQVLLTKHKHEVSVAGDGASGTALARDANVDIMLVDLHLPGSPSGVDLVRELRRLRPECPIIVVSGYPTPERLDELREMGVSDFLTKPFEVGFITDTISRLLKCA